MPIIDGELPIGSDFDVDYNPKNKSGAPIVGGVATWHLLLLGGSGGPQEIASDTLPEITPGRYFTNIPSEITAMCVEESIYAVRVVFSGSGYDDVNQRKLVAKYKDE